ncbi:serine carboxypeptidase-like clade II [Marchantia polymorpha subsp. ruderalis]
MLSSAKGSLSMMTLQVSAVICIVLSLTGAGAVIAAPEEDLVTKLPGLPSLGFKIYSGYVTVDEQHGRALFYFFVEAQKDPENKPLTLWLNGGPGCSSFGIGNFNEHGPFAIRENTIVINPYSWNKESNVLYLESPAGVGFSYSNTTIDYVTDDERTAQDAFVFLHGWLEKFPEYQNRPFYMTGESYAGLYIPQLAALFFNSDLRLQLRGIMIGNPVINVEEDLSYPVMLFFLYTHGVISEESYRRLEVECGISNRSTQDNKACRETMDNVFYSETGMIDWYDVLSDTCASDRNFMLLTSNLQLPKIRTSPTGLSRVHVTPADPCHENDMVPYLAREDVQAALHAHLANASIPWSVCSDIVEYISTTVTVEPELKLLITSDIRVWVYSGDQDSIIPFTATRRTVEKFSQATGLRISSHYQPWFADNQIGGWTVSYGSNLLFATVRGASHMVPRSQPVRGLQIFTSFLRDNNLPLRQE